MSDIPDRLHGIADELEQSDNHDYGTQTANFVRILAEIVNADENDQLDQVAETLSGIQDGVTND